MVGIVGGANYDDDRGDRKELSTIGDALRIARSILRIITDKGDR